MPPGNLEELLASVNGFITGEGSARRFAMAPGALESPPVAMLINDAFPLDGGTWVLTEPTEPTIHDGAVIFAGTMARLLGVAAARLAVRFDLDDGGLPSLLVELSPLEQPVPPTAWDLGVAFPVWAEERSVLTEVGFTTPTFWFSSMQRRSEHRPRIEPGLTFSAGSADLTGVLGPLALLPGMAVKDLDGSIDGPSGAPHTAIVAAPSTPIPVPGLDLPLIFSAVSTTPTETGPTRTPPAAVATYLQLVSYVHIGSAPPIPVTLQFSGLGDLIPLTADLREASRYAMSELQTFAHNAPISSMLDTVFTIGKSAELRDLGVFVGLQPLSLAAISLSIGTSKSLTVVEHWVEIPDVQVDFMVNTPVSNPSVTAVLRGSFLFLDGVPVEVLATFPEMVFTGSIRPEHPIPLAALVRRFIPSVTQFPDLDLDVLYLAADLTQKRYAFSLTVSSDWQIPIGIARFQLVEASLALGYDGQNTGAGFSGEIQAVANLYTNDGTKIAEFAADWVLPGANFLLQGTFPDIDLTTLATTLTGGGVPNSAAVPEIVLRNSLVRLRMGEGAGRVARLTGETPYRFDLATTINAPGIGSAALSFEIRRGTDGQTGFAAGLVLQPDWTPDALWSGLSGVMSVLHVTDAGLILSSITDDTFTLPGLDQLPYVPDKIDPGVTFFSALLLKGDTIGLLQHLFGAGIELDLYAHVDPSNLAASDIKAMLPASSGRGAVQFTGLTLDLKPGAEEFSITAGARFAVFNERLTLKGRGAITLGPPPTAAFAISVSDWEHPFGITGLTIKTFGLSVTLDEIGVGIGLLGDFVIGEDPNRFEFIIGGQIVDFEAPDALVFALQATAKRPLKVTDLVKQFTSLDLSEVPLLDGLAFVALSFYVVADPGGWVAPDGHFYPAGIGIDADLLLYEWELKLKLEVSEKRGILADGSLSKPIVLGEVLTVSDLDGTSGPRMKIDTSGLLGIRSDRRVTDILARRSRPLPDGVEWAVMPLNPYTIAVDDQAKAYFTASGAVHVLGVYESFSGSVTSDGFDVNFHTDLAHLFVADVRAAFSRSSGFEGHASGRFDFSLDFPDGVSIDGWQVLPPVVVHGPNAALVIDIVLTTSAQSIACALDFTWGSFHINPHFSLDAAQVKDMLVDLWTHLVDWIRTNVKTFFADLVSSAARYVEALASGFLWAAQSAVEIVEALVHVFKVEGLHELAQLIVKIDQLSFDDIVDALMTVLDKTFSEVVSALEAAGKSCAVATNQAVLYSGAARREVGG